MTATLTTLAGAETTFIIYKRATRAARHTPLPALLRPGLNSAAWTQPGLQPRSSAATVPVQDTMSATVGCRPCIGGGPCLRSAHRRGPAGPCEATRRELIAVPGEAHHG